MKVELSRTTEQDSKVPSLKLAVIYLPNSKLIKIFLIKHEAHSLNKQTKPTPLEQAVNENHWIIA